MNDYRITIKDYYENLIGCLWDEEEAKAEIEEMKAAKVGTIKPDCWEKIGEDEFIIFVM